MTDDKIDAADFWKTRIVAEGLSQYFRLHLLPLFVAFRIGNETRQEIYTGFLLRHKKVLYWVTAGHVIDLIRRYTSHPDVQVKQKGWIDGCDLHAARILPALLDPDVMFAVDENGIDVGAIRINYIEEQSLSSSNPIIIMDEEAWLRVNVPHPHGFYLIGYPTEAVVLIDTELSESKTHHHFNAPLHLLPVTGIEGTQNTFRGRIIPFLGETDYSLGDIDGMSGGPIFSLEDFGGTWKYRLVALQSSWIRDRREIIAMPMSSVAQVLELWASNPK